MPPEVGDLAGYTVVHSALLLQDEKCGFFKDATTSLVEALPFSLWTWQINDLFIQIQILLSFWSWIICVKLRAGICVKSWEPLSPTFWWRRPPSSPWCSPRQSSGLPSGPASPRTLASGGSRGQQVISRRLWGKPLKLKRCAPHSSLTVRSPGSTFSSEAQG